MFQQPSGPRIQTQPHSFSTVPHADIPRSSFNRSHGHKTTFDAGYLIPIYADEALPGDTFSLNMTTFARMATPIAPIMDNLYCDVFFFAVPIRLIWDNWEKFNGAQDAPGDSTDYLVPQATSVAGTYVAGSLHDYLGLPTGISGIEHSILWHRAYNLIWNEWFRDENLQNPADVFKDDGPDNVTGNSYNLRKRGKRHDYFTSALPWPQKGDAVSLPLGTYAPVVTNGLQPTYSSDANTNIGVMFKQSLGGALGFSSSTILGGSDRAVIIGNQTGMRTDLSAATAATVNQLREAFQMQKLFERDARGGTRYTEIIRAHFGVVSPDARLQRPEYLGGGTTMINLSPIPQTSSTDATTPQGNLSAMGTFSHSGVGFNKSFTEHCVLLGMVSVRADLSYQQGLNRMFSRRTRYDFYWPALSHIGEQAILNKELYAQGTSADDDVFGYQERYAEYRYKPSQITGQLRSTYAQTLDQWHLAQEFSTLPTLSSAFIEEDPPIDRVIAVPAAPHFIFDSAINLKCARPMPVYSVPGLIDHF